MFCEYCGNKIDDDSVFCFNCGAKLDYDSEELVDAASIIEDDVDVLKCSKEENTFIDDIVDEKDDNQNELDGLIGEIKLGFQDSFEEVKSNTIDVFNEVKNEAIDIIGINNIRNFKKKAKAIKDILKEK